ncbi:TPA: hypothetical protein SLZ46_001053 [Vibrio cholerae]|uniref:hypothetical protein n=1 Tax=Vibrio cholerae TaxID=666 RepID=UPI00129B1617|nr:hypothetical protein [Vibrio cholerae]MRI13575.1 hypothetical protein [Vibrio cholerae]HEJ2449551.1 hypothetical protein [Vibrio cholerae]HEJ2464097.1 hypothetical protein [Vibrio cholerae]
MKKYILMLIAVCTSFTASAYTMKQAEQKMLLNRSVYFSYLDACKVPSSVNTSQLADPLLFIVSDLTLRTNASIDVVNNRLERAKRGESVDTNRIEKEKQKIQYNKALLVQVASANNNQLLDIEDKAMSYNPNGFFKTQCDSLSAYYADLTRFINQK